VGEVAKKPQNQGCKISGNGDNSKMKDMPKDLNVRGHLWALRKVNQALLVGLEAAANTMEHWDQLDEDTRRSMIESIKGLIEQGKEAYANVPEIGPGDAQATKH